MIENFPRYKRKYVRMPYLIDLVEDKNNEPKEEKK